MRLILTSLLWIIAGFAVVSGGLWIRPAVVGGGSMEPALVRGDVCIAVSGVPIREDDIVLFTDRDSLVLHRVQQLSESNELQTKGDANPVRDRVPVPIKRVRGRVVLTIPLGKLVGGWMPSSRGDKLQNQSHSEAMTERRSGT